MDGIGGRRRCLAGLLGLLALAGCALSAPGDHADVQRELNRSRRQWEAQGLEDYRFVARRVCFCGGEFTTPVVVEVRGGEVVSRTYQDSGQPVSTTYEGLWPAVEGVFDIIQDAIDREAHRIEVEYDPELRHPTSIGIDFLEHAVDEELGINVSDLAPLPAN
jgi:hypothetical protein